MNNFLTICEEYIIVKRGRGLENLGWELQAQKRLSNQFLESFIYLKIYLSLSHNKSNETL